MRRRGKYVFGILILIWMSIIFLFSARPADVSTQDSNFVGMAIGNLFVPGFRGWTEEQQLEFAQKVDHPVRKTAHATEYAVLGFLVMGYCRCAQDAKKRGYNEETKYKKMLPAWIFGTVYAATDEFHQLFVPGRSGQVSDVMLDSAGVFLGVLVLCGSVRVWQICFGGSRRKKEETER